MGLLQIRPHTILFALGLALINSWTFAGTTDPVAKLFGGLPLNLAIKEVRGSGLRTFATFEDPYCPYCQQLNSEIANMTDVTIYTFIYPVLKAASKKTAEAIWCSPNQSMAWNDWMTFRIAPKAPSCDVGAIDKLLALGEAMNIRGIPTIFLANGERYSGAKSKMELEMAISSPKIMSFQAELGKKQR